MDLVVTSSGRALKPGDTGAFNFSVANTSDRDETYEYRLETDDHAFSLAWCEVSGPRVLGAGELGAGVCTVRLPERGTPSPGPYALRIVAVCRESRESTSATCTVTIEEGRQRCVAFPVVPKVTIEPDGSVTAKVSLFNCGALDVDIDLHFRHIDGWHFELDDPTLQVHVGRGPIEVDVELKVPAGRRVEPGDEVETDARCDGESLAQTRSTVQLVPRAPAPPPSRMLAIVASVLVLIVAGAFAAWQLRDQPTDNEVDVAGEVVTPEPDDSPSNATGTATESPESPTVPPVEITALDTKRGNCDVRIVWETTTPGDGKVELKREGEVIFEGSLGAGDYTDSDFSPAPPVEVTYELFASNESGEDSQEVTETAICPEIG